MSDTLPLDLTSELAPVRHGAARLDRPADGSRPTWHLVAKPHVMILLKRVFPRIRATVTGVVTVAHSPSVAAELTWFMSRYDLRMDPADREFLHAEARKHHEAEESTFRILAGEKGVAGGGFHEMSGETMRDYQRVAADLISQNRRVLVTDEIGLGKTLTGLATLRNPGARPAVCVVQTHLTGQWQRYVSKVWPMLTTHIAKTANPKTDKRAYDPDVLILNYAKLAGWRYHLAGVARTVIFDEVQDLRGGTGTDKGQAAAHIAGEAQYVVGLTQTPIYNYGDEMHSVMQIVRPDSLGTREEFIREWCGGATMGGKHAVVKDPKALGEYLRDSGVMIGRTRKEVGRELPYGEPLKIPHPVSADSAVLERMTGNAVEMARLILSAQSEAKDRFVTSGELDMMMRQATGIAKSPYVSTFVQGLLESQERVVLWGWHHAVYDMWQEQLRRAGIISVRYSGKDSPRQKALALARFTGEPEEFGVSWESLRGMHRNEVTRARVLIMSLRSGAGVDGLQNHCSVGVFGELDWSPQVHEQCLGRLARDGQENEVLGYYLMAEEGSDPTIAAALGMKHAQSEPMIRPNSGNVTPLPTGGVNGGRVKDLARSILEQAGVRVESPTLL